MKIIAIVECSDGNESVGEMWKEVKSFSADTTLGDVFKWFDTFKSRGNIIIARERE